MDITTSASAAPVNANDVVTIDVTTSTDATSKVGAGSPHLPEPALASADALTDALGVSPSLRAFMAQNY